MSCNVEVQLNLFWAWDAVVSVNCKAYALITIENIWNYEKVHIAVTILSLMTRVKIPLRVMSILCA